MVVVNTITFLSSCLSSALIFFNADFVVDAVSVGVVVVGIAAVVDIAVLVGPDLVVSIVVVVGIVVFESS